MTGLDTSVLVRYIMQDDPKQSPLATRLMEALTVGAPGYVPVVTLVELAWVLEASYELERSQLVQAFETLLRTQEVLVERSEIVWKALRLFGGGKADFADCLIERSAAAAGCARTMTFDRQAARDCGMVLVS